MNNTIYTPKNITTVLVKRKISDFFRYLVMILYTFLCIYPFVWILISSFKNNEEVYAGAFTLPETFKIINYFDALSKADIIVSFTNSIIASFCSITLLLIIAAMASYILARVKPMPRLYLFFTIGIMIPIHAMLIPTFVIMKNMGILNTRVGLITVYIASNLSLSIFILTGFMRTIPYEMEEAATIDGCSNFMTFIKIIFPLSKSGLATIGTLAFVNCWNDFLLAKLIISKPLLKTITIGITELQGQHITYYGMLCAGLIISIIPVTLIYTFFQENVIKGMTSGATKG